MSGKLKGLGFQGEEKKMDKESTSKKRKQEAQIFFLNKKKLIEFLPSFW